MSLVPAGVRARRATLVTFALVGATSAVWVVRIPALRDKLGLSELQVGIEVLAWGAGALVAMQFSSRLIASYGSHRILRYGVSASVASLLLLAFAPSFPFLVIGGLIFGSLFGLVDVAANAQAALLERMQGRPLMGRMHAGWSLGAVLGGVFGSVTAGLGLGFTASVATASLLALPAALLCMPHFMTEGQTKSGSADHDKRRKLPRTVYLLGILIFCAFLAEGSVADWSSLHLHDGLGASQAIAALGYPAFELAMLIGRMFCDAVTQRFGGRSLLAAAGVAGAAGFATFVMAPGVVSAIAALVLIGIAVCVVVPLTFSLAGIIGDDRASAAIARAGTFGYSGLLLGPVAIGLIAEHSSLRTGFAVIIIACLTITFGALALPDLRIKATHQDAHGQNA
ncbi:MFS transporter [Streptomyces sp. NPDC091376]|uniref:MFS transporter n=1 Tax=Streptomyces sp. NPDC091376 TaxID=3365994 RepID=UPI00380A2C3A